MKPVKLNRQRVSTPVIMTFLVIFFPLGLLLMWIFTNWTFKTKMLLTNASLYLFIIGIIAIIAINSASPSTNVDNAEQSDTVQVKNDAELQQPRHNFDDFYEWSTTSITSPYGRAYGGRQGDSQERWAYINSKCSISQDTDGDGDKDQYYDKACLQAEYSEYLRPSAFDYGSSKVNGGSWICPVDGEKYYSYVCSIYGDMITHTSASKLSSAFEPAKEREKAEVIYNEIAKTKGDN